MKPLACDMDRSSPIRCLDAQLERLENTDCAVRDEVNRDLAHQATDGLTDGDSKDPLCLRRTMIDAPHTYGRTSSGSLHWRRRLTTSDRSLSNRSADAGRVADV